MATPISTVHGPLYIARQSTQGTAATTGFKKYHRVSGKVYTKKEISAAEWLDGSRYADSFDYTASLEVAGQFQVHGSADAIASLAAYALGDDDITGSATPYTHTVTPALTVPYLTIVTALGEDPNNQVLEHYDVQITSLSIEGTADNDVLIAEVEVIGINPGKVRAAEPTAASENEDPLLHYNAEDNFVLAGLDGGDEVKAVNQAKITINNGIEAYYGDSVRPVALVPGRGEITVDFTLLCDDETLPMLNSFYYGTETPSNGDEPVTDVFKEGFSVTYGVGSGSTERSVAFDIPELVYMIEEYPEASPDGNPIEIAATGMARIEAGSGPEDIISIVAKTADSTSYSDGSSPPAPPGS